MSTLATALVVVALLPGTAAATRVYQSEYYDTEAQARAALSAFEADVLAAGYTLSFDASTEQVHPVGDSFYFAVAYDGFALTQPPIYSSSYYPTREDAADALSWFLGALQPASIHVVESGVRDRGARSYFWARYLGDALPKPSQYASAPYPTNDEAQGGLQTCLGAAYGAKAIVLEKDVRPGRDGSFYWLRYLGPKLNCSH